MRRIYALFTADWLDVIFVHFAVAPNELQPHIPFPLDLFDGDAYVSLVAFTQHRLRPAIGGRLAEFLSAPLAHHEFLNVRTYVRVNDEPGIHFLVEWIPNRVATWIGPATYGLPYQLGRLDYSSNRRRIVARSNALCFTAADANIFRPAQQVSVDQFLLEQYTAFTDRAKFRINHAPWPQARIDVELRCDELLKAALPWWPATKPRLAHRSPGVYDVQIGFPQRIHSYQELQ